jgi:hypothetical protein
MAYFARVVSIQVNYGGAAGKLRVNRVPLPDDDTK